MAYLPEQASPLIDYRAIYFAQLDSRVPIACANKNTQADQGMMAGAGTAPAAGARRGAAGACARIDLTPADRRTAHPRFLPAPPGVRARWRPGAGWSCLHADGRMMMLTWSQRSAQPWRCSPQPAASSHGDVARAPVMSYRALASSSAVGFRSHVVIIISRSLQPDDDALRWR